MAESILVVDDNLDNRDLTRILLECEGYEVRLAEDATQALGMFETYRPKLILMDVQLPGMDGLELTRRLRQKPALHDVIIVALSAYAMVAEKANALRRVATATSPNPLTPGPLRAPSRNIWSSRRGRGTWNRLWPPDRPAIRHHWEERAILTVSMISSCENGFSMNP